MTLYNYVFFFIFFIQTLYNYVKWGYIGMSKTPLYMYMKRWPCVFTRLGSDKTMLDGFLLMSIADDMLHFQRNIVNDLIFYMCKL